MQKHGGAAEMDAKSIRFASESQHQGRFGPLTPSGGIESRAGRVPAVSRSEAYEDCFRPRIG